MTGFRTASRRTVHRGRKFDLEVLRLVRTSAPRRPALTREVVRHPGAVVVLPILDDRRIILVRVWRIALARWSLELPAGTLEPRERPIRCAARELIEETGFRAATLTPIARFHTSPGMSDELMRAFVARGLTPVGQRPEEDELIAPRLHTIDDVLRLIDRGLIHDAKSIAAVLLAERQGFF